MKLKGIRSIALLVAAVILVIGSVAGIAAAGGEERDEEFRWDACYWWETPPLTAYERQQMKDIMVHIFNHYFGMDISRKSPKELVELGYAIGHQNQQKALRLFWSYAEERGFELPLGILDVPAEPRQEFIPRPDAYYWWEFIDPERWCDEWLTRMKKEFPDIDIMRLTPEEMDDLLNPPAPPLRLIPIEEKKQCPGVHAVFGRARTYTSEAEIREWLDRLFEVIGGDPPLCGQLRCAFFVRTLAVSGSGYVTVDLDADRATREEVVRLAPKIYAVITQRAEELGIEDVPVAFRHTRLVRLPYNCRSGEPVRMEKIIPPLPAACFMRFKRQGLDFEIIQQLLMADRVEIAPATMEPLVPEEVPLPTPRVSSSSAAPKPPAHQEKDRPISGGLKMQFDHGYRWYYFVRKDRVVHRELRPFRPIGSTGFAVIDPMPWPWPDDVDYTITGHMGPSAWIFICLYTERILGEDITATDVNDQVFQASVARTEKAGMVEAVATVPAYADVARVGIDNWHVEPDILSVGGREETIVSWRDPVVYEDVWASGRATGVTHGWVVENLKSVFCPVFGALQNQFRANLWSAGGDSGGPVFRRLPFGEVQVVGVVWGAGKCPIYGLVYTYFSPISGVKKELPGWYPYTR